jgi:hypothetical protein
LEAWNRVLVAEQRWKSQRRKINRLAYRFSIDVSLLGLV